MQGRADEALRLAGRAILGTASDGSLEAGPEAAQCWALRVRRTPHDGGALGPGEVTFGEVDPREEG